jgi:hypothetical protein
MQWFARRRELNPTVGRGCRGPSDEIIETEVLCHSKCGT